MTSPLTRFLTATALPLSLMMSCIQPPSPQPVWFGDLETSVAPGTMTFATGYFMKSRQTVTLGAEGEAYVLSLLRKYPLKDAHDDRLLSHYLHGPALRICFRWCRDANGKPIKLASPELLLPSEKNELYYIDICPEERQKLEEFLQSRK